MPSSLYTITQIPPHPTPHTPTHPPTHTHPHTPTLFQARTRGTEPTPRSSRVASTTRAWARARSRQLASMTWRMMLASLISSSVARKAATSCVGSFWMKPTVSVRSTSCPPGRRARRVSGSSVANSLSSASVLVIGKGGRLSWCIVYNNVVVTRHLLCCIKCAVMSHVLLPPVVEQMRSEQACSPIPGEPTTSQSINHHTLEFLPSHANKVRPCARTLRPSGRSRASTCRRWCNRPVPRRGWASRLGDGDTPADACAPGVGGEREMW